MPSPTWDEYLEQAKEHIKQMQQVIEEEGAPLPSPPVHPTDPLPKKYNEAAKELAEQYDELVAEVLTRMAAIKDRQSTIDKWNLQESPAPLFINIVS